MSSENFTVADYIIFVLTISISASIGIYFGCFGSKQKTATEYLLGKGRMKAIPVGLSLFSSAISVVTIVGSPGEMYIFGSQFYITYLGMFLSMFMSWIFILPVFCGKLNIKTPYEYFELRFNYKIRLLSTIIYIVHAMVLLPIILYGATVSFSEVSQIYLPICTTVIGGICILYTMVGGFAAVIWSDTLQATLMLASCILVMVKGILQAGGIGETFYWAGQGKRLNFFDMNPNPFERLTFWSALIGMFFHYGAHSGCSASSIQRYISLKNEKQARISTFIGSLGAIIIGTVVCIIGLTMFVQYYGCDPVKNKEVDNYSKLLSHYVAYTVKDIPGFSGFFMAGILSAGLSTLSAELNVVAGLIYYDLIKKNLKMSFDETKGVIVMKILVLIIGLYSLALAPFLDRVQYLSAFALGINSVLYGVILGIMILGTSIPICNSIGIAVGSLTGAILTAWISFQSLHYNTNAPYMLPLSTDNCPDKNNSTFVTNTTRIAADILQTDEIPLLYKLSYMYYVPFGTIVTIIVACIVSYLTGGNDLSRINPYVFLPYVRSKFYPQTYTPENIAMLTKDENNQTKKTDIF